MDIIYFHPSISEVTLRTAALLCLTGAYPPQLGVRAVDILSRRAIAGSGDNPRLRRRRISSFPL